MSLCARRRVVDADHSGTDAVAEPPHRLRVVGIDRRRQSVAVTVAQLQSLVESVEPADSHERPERLGLVDLIVWRHAIGDRRVGIPANAWVTDKSLARV